MLIFPNAAIFIGLQTTGPTGSHQQFCPHLASQRSLSITASPVITGFISQYTIGLGTAILEKLLIIRQFPALRYKR